MKKSLKVFEAFQDYDTKAIFPQFELFYLLTIYKNEGGSMNKRYHFLFLPVLMMFLSTCITSAQWNSAPTVNNAIANASTEQELTAMTTDGAGGAIITWLDFGDSNWDIYRSDGVGGEIIAWLDRRDDNGSIYTLRIFS